MSSQAVDNTVWNRAQRCRIYKKRCGGITSFLQSPFVLWCSCFVLHDAPLDIIDIYLSYCFSPPIKASRPNFEKPIHNWNPHLPRRIVSRKWKPQQPKCWNILKHHPLLTLLLPCISLLGCCRYIIGLTEVEAGPKRTRSYEFGTYCSDHTNGLCTFHQFLFSDVASTLCTLTCSSGHSTWKLWVQEWSGIFYANLQKLYILNHFELWSFRWRHGQTWLIFRQEFDNTHVPCVKSWGPSDLPN